MGATYAKCDGTYRYIDAKVNWAPERPVYKHVTKDRYIFYGWVKSLGTYGWMIGPGGAQATRWTESHADPKSNSGHFYFSKYYLNCSAYKPFNYEKLTNMAYMISGGLNTAEPWQGRWNDGDLVKCVGNI